MCSRKFPFSSYTIIQCEGKAHATGPALPRRPCIRMEVRCSLRLVPLVVVFGRQPKQRHVLPFVSLVLGVVFVNICVVVCCTVSIYKYLPVLKIVIL